MLESILRFPALAEHCVDSLVLIVKSAVVVGLAVAGVRLLGLAV